MKSCQCLFFIEYFSKVFIFYLIVQRLHANFAFLQYLKYSTFTCIPRSQGGNIFRAHFETP